MRGDLVLTLLVVIAIFGIGCVAGEGRPPYLAGASAGSGEIPVRGTSEQLYGLGFMEMNNERFEDALELFDLAIERNAEDQMMDAARIYETKGECLRSMGQCEEAIQWYEEALSRNKYLVAATAGLSRCKTDSVLEGLSSGSPDDVFSGWDEVNESAFADTPPTTVPTPEPVPPRGTPLTSVDLIMQRSLNLSKERWDFDYYCEGSPLVIMYKVTVANVTHVMYNSKKDILINRTSSDPNAWVKVTAYNPDTGERVEDGYGGSGHYSRDPIKEVDIRTEGRYHVSIEGRYAVIDVAIWGK